MSKEVLGFIGLGSIGAPMAARLVAAGHQVIGFDVAGTQERLPSDAVAAGSVEEVAAQAEVVFMSLPDRPICAVRAIEEADAHSTDASQVMTDAHFADASHWLVTPTRELRAIIPLTPTRHMRLLPPS